MLKLDREKYISILKSQGISAALTALHRDTNLWEIETFEGEKGYQPEMFSDLNGVRQFSRELWEMALAQQKPNPGHH